MVQQRVLEYQPDIIDERLDVPVMVHVVLVQFSSDLLQTNGAAKEQKENR